MSTHQDVNFCLGSWGPQPKDRSEPAPAVSSASLLTADDWHELAMRWSRSAMVAIGEGKADIAAGYARGAARFCLEHQKAGGKPWDSTEDAWKCEHCGQLEDSQFHLERHERDCLHRKPKPPEGDEDPFARTGWDR